MSSAYDGENYEHSQGLWAAVKSHPMAAFWAFTMCFTIVSFDTYPASLAPEFGREIWIVLALRRGFKLAELILIPSRSWNRLTCS